MLSEEIAIKKLIKIREDTAKANECGLSNNDFKEEIEVYDVVLNIIDRLRKENEEENKRTNDLEFALLDMVMQFANRVKTKGCSYALDTMGLSALELAFNELGFNEMHPVNKAEEKYKILEKQYYEN